MSALRLRRVLPALALIVSLLALATHAVPARATDLGELGPKPAMCGIGCWGDGTSLAVSRLGYFTLNPTIVHVGQKVTAAWHRLSTVGDWSWPFHGRGCARKDSATCTFRATAATGGWSVVTIGISNPIGAAESQNVYAVIGKDQAVIDGYVNDKTGGGVGGVSIDITGSHRYGVTSGADGFFSVIVKPGRYAVDPSGGPGKRPRYEPRIRDLSVANGDTASADFTLDEGLDLTLKLDKSAVPADGLGVVSGTINVTKYGKPDPGVPVSFSADGPARGVLCQGSGRIWPAGTVALPDLLEQPVVTDAHGKYAFTVQVGTVPGAFKIIAWAQDGLGQNITDDISAARDEKTLEETSLGSNSATSFPGGIAGLAGSAATANAPGDPYGIYTLFASLISSDPHLGGIAVAYVGSNFGSSVIIYDAATPPKISKEGDIVSAPNGYVFDPLWWSGSTGMSNAISTGKLTNMPTLLQWSQGQTVGLWHIQDGMTPPGLATVGTDSFQGFGYGYPNPAGCS